MPRIAIISDIHANLLALERVFEDAQKQRVDQIVSLGDISGYGPEPVECTDLVRARCHWSLCGNHDIALFMDYAVGFNKIAREAIDWHRMVLKPRWFSFSKTFSRWHWLRGLRPERLEGEVLYVHASPRDPIFEYVDEGDVADMGFGPSQKIVEIFEKIPWLSFCGHSHRPGVVTEEFHWIKPAQLEDLTYYLPVTGKTLVNVGSVGQPRDGNPDSCYAIFDSDQKTIQFRRVAYDVRAAQERFKKTGKLHEKCWQRIQFGT